MDPYDALEGILSRHYKNAGFVIIYTRIYPDRARVEMYAKEGMVPPEPPKIGVPVEVVVHKPGIVRLADSKPLTPTPPPGGPGPEDESR